MSNRGARTGRPAGGDGGNRERILAAARQQFAAHGFRGATMRAIAARAGFDVALVAHYFGSKERLFAATLQLPEGADRLLVQALAGPLQTQGERLTRGYLGLWESPATGAHLRVLARATLSNEVATARMGDLLGGMLEDSRVVELLAGRRAGFTLAMSHLLGVAVTRYLTGVPVLAELDLEELVGRVAPAVQLHLERADG